MFINHLGTISAVNCCKQGWNSKVGHVKKKTCNYLLVYSLFSLGKCDQLINVLVFETISNLLKHKFFFVF